MCVCVRSYMRVGRMLRCDISVVFRGSLTRKVRASAKALPQNLPGSLEQLATTIPLGWPTYKNKLYVSQCLP